MTLVARLRVVFQRFDFLIGKYMFVPPIVRFCQVTGWSQYRVYNHLMVLVAGSFAVLTVNGWNEFESDWVIIWVLHIFSIAFWALLIVSLIVRAAIDPDRKPKTTPKWDIRVVFMVLLTVLIVRGIWKGDWELNLIAMVFNHLAAFYALTIETIPPREIKGRKIALEATR